MPSSRSKRLFAAVVFFGSIVVLATQLINPSPIMVTVDGNGGEVAELGEYFQYGEVLVIATAAVLLGASGTYVLTSSGPRLGDEPPTVPPADPIPDGASPPAESASGVDRLPADELLAERRPEWEETLDRLANKERDVYEALLEADGVLPQSEVVEATDLSKASVSRALDNLEVRNLVERKRRGMGNIVYLR